MPSTVYANGRTIVHAGDGLVFVAAGPDVCKTPSPGGPIPVPYPNTAKSSDLSDGTTTVKLQGKSAAIKGANLSTSTGDEAGTAGGGIISSKTKGKMTWLVQSMDVKFEGKGVIRFLDSNMHNSNMGNVPSVNAGSGGGGLASEQDALCPVCNKPFEGHKDVIPPRSKASDKEANKLLKPDKPRTQWTKDQQRHGGSHMVSALVIDCKSSGQSVFTAGAGNTSNSLTQTNFATTAVNVLTNQSIGSVKTPTGSNPVGNCGEQAAIHEARAHFPLGKDCKASITAVTNPKGKPTPPCDTCKRVLTAMLCDEGPTPATRGR